MNTRNTVCWTDIPVTDLGRAVTFYAAVLDQDIKKQEGEGYEMAMFFSEKEHGDFCLAPLENRKPGSNGPLIYLSVEGRLEDAISQVEPNGGKILHKKEKIGPYGFRALIEDSEGNGLALHSMEDS